MNEDQKNPYLCDGCNVREPFEHRCHGSDGAWRGDPPCRCPEPECLKRQHPPLACPECGAQVRYRAAHYVSSVGHDTPPEDAIDPYWTCDERRHD